MSHTQSFDPEHQPQPELVMRPEIEPHSPSGHEQSSPAAQPAPSESTPAEQSSPGPAYWAPPQPSSPAEQSTPAAQSAPEPAQSSPAEPSTPAAQSAPEPAQSAPAEQSTPAAQSAPEPAQSPSGQSQQYVFDLDGGRACLDFANTLGSSPTSTDHLTDYADLVAFAAQSGLLTPDDADWLRAQGKLEPVAAAGVLRRAKRIRQAMRAIFARLAAGKELAGAELAALNTELAATLSHARVVPTSDGQTYRWGWSGRNMDAPLWPITRSAADLLTSDEERALVRECGADDCAWLFMDTTRNRSRQWCSMQGCGNREKARRHYQRRRGARGKSASTGEALRER